MNKKEVKEKTSNSKKTGTKTKISYQKIFNIISGTFILACTIFYGTRFIKFYKESHKLEEIKVLADDIIEDNKNNKNFKKINNIYYFTEKNNNNYIKYSNLLWRIIRINDNKSVTLSLDNSITVLSPGDNKEYSKTEINKWLNKSELEKSGILEKNLNNPSYYLSNTNTCNDNVNDTKSITCNNRISNTLITVPSINDYINTGSQKSFMNNEEYFYLTNFDNKNNMWYINSDGNPKVSDKNDILGIKPVITIKNNIILIDGNGTKENPYIIEKENSLFGSYVKLDNDLWRIFDIEDKNVKLSLDRYLKINNKDLSYQYSNTNYYHNDTKKASLAYYLNNNYLNSLSYKNKIEENKFSNGLYSNITNYNYEKVLNTTIDTKIGLLSIGDIIINPFNTNYYLSTGISQNSNEIYLMKNDFKLITSKVNNKERIIPTINIDKNILTEGKGTKEEPLEVK